ncbi:hypothetical protein [Azohydromonas lata]|uniref:hypothetical protein n=1 Tax=Azohydromonas lata TaxID=45677 RepID=UPI000835045C|nr:hypothetical protein [Azohydromonas lata]
MTEVAATAAFVAKKATAKVPVKKAAGKKTVRKANVNGANEPAPAAGGESAAAPEAPPATDTPGAEAAAS